MTARYCLADCCKSPNVPMPADDNRLACSGCWARLEQQLAEMPWMVGQLNYCIARRARYTLTGPAGVEEPLAYDKDASDALDLLQCTLWPWVREGMASHTDMAGSVTPGAVGLSRACLRLADWLQRHPESQKFIEEVDAAWVNAGRAIRAPAPQKPLGPCFAPVGDGAVCPNPLWYRDGDKKTRCIRCETQWDVRERLAGMVDMMSGTLADVPELILSAQRVGLKVTQPQISKWKKSGMLTAHGTSPERYDLDQVLALASQQKGRGRPRLDNA